MRNFDEYGIYSSSERVVKSGEFVFEKQLLGAEGYDIEITYCDGSKKVSKAQILNHLNDTNVSKEQRILNSRNKDEISKGCIVKTLKDGEIYIVLSNVDNHYSYKSSTMLQCNNKLRFSWLKEDIPCYSDKSSYGVKIFRADSDFEQTADTNLLVTVQRNKETETIDINHRFIIGGSKHGVWKVGKIGVDEKGLFVFTCKNDKFIDGLDSDIDNIAFNGVIDDIPKEPTEYTILGDDSIKINYEYIYESNPSNTNAVFSLDEYTIENNLAQIVNQSEGKVVIKSFVSDEIITLVCHIGDEKITKNIMTIRR